MRGDRYRPGGSSEPNGPNQRAHDAARDAGLNRVQQEEFQRQLEREHENLPYRDLRDRAEDIRRKDR